ncbi:MAG: BON domain-containing protein [Verrucomicrobiia bacterium]
MKSASKLNSVLRFPRPNQDLSSIGLALALLLTNPASSPAQVTSNSPPGNTDSSSPQDAVVKRAIERQIILDKQIPSHQVKVDFDDGVVTLSGTVHNLLAKERALRIARAARGVRQVTDHLEVDTSGQTDASVRDQLLLALASDPATDVFDVDVEVENGIVTLTGIVDSWAERERVATVTKGVNGVRSIRNGLSVDLSQDRPDEAMPAGTGQRPEADLQPQDDSSGVRASRGRVSLSDAELESPIKRALRRDAGLPVDAVQVQVRNGEATLSGQLGTLLARDRAVSLANAVRGVTGVYNRIRVAPPTRPDAAVRSDLREALENHPVTEDNNFDLQIQQGVATLRGTVQSWQQRQTAADMARSIRGVRGVRNELQVRYESQRSDEEIAAEVRSRLRRDALTTDDPVSVRVQNGRVFLTGHVDTLLEKRAAIADAWVLNVVAVDARNLRVFHSPPLAQQNVPGSGRQLTSADSALESRLRTALIRNPFVDAGELTLRVRQGTAYLDGVVESTNERLEAEETASQIRGIRNVRNSLRVLPDTEGYETWPFYDMNPADNSAEP